MNTTETEGNEAPVDATAEEDKEQQELSLEVAVDKPSACERHVTVTVSREDIDRYLEAEFDELAPKAEVPGFRPGRAPRKLIVSRFKEQVSGQVKGKLLMDSMAQVSETHDFSTISEPDLDVDVVEVPDEGPMTFEFNVEVRPEFDLPEWKGLSLEEPVRETTDADVQQHLEKLLQRFGKLVPVDDPAKLGDIVTLNMTFTHDGNVLSEIQERTLPLKAKLSFRDAELEQFGDLLVGSKAGDVKETTFTISDEAENEELQGQQANGKMEVLKVERLDLPDLTSSFLDEIGGFTDESELRDAVREELERQQKYRRQQRIREQITKELTASANWELPPALLRRQARRELRRMVLELQASGFGDDVIQAHSNQLQRNILAHTSTALKEHFILERLAEEEKIDVENDDYDREIELIAEQNGIPPRRVRARLEKRGEMDSLRNQIVERKVIELITRFATMKEVPFETDADDVTAIDHAVSGEQDKPDIPEAKHAEEGKALPGTPERG